MSKKMRCALACLLLSGLLLAPTRAVAGTVEYARWFRVNIPAEGDTAGWLLASGADVRHLTVAPDGTLYCSADPSGTSQRLFKSTDGGATWAQAGNVQDEIVDIAVSPEGAVYYATASAVFKSTDAGRSFTALPAGPGGSGTGNVEITSIAVVTQGAASLTAVGTRDADGGEYGGVYLLDEGDMGAGWRDTALGSLDVYAVAFSPGFASDGQLIAVASDETDWVVTSKVGDGDWGADTAEARTAGMVPESAAIAFPDAYQGSGDGATFFVGISTGSGSGDAYRVTRAGDALEATALGIGAGIGLTQVDITSLDVAGDRLLAGAAGSADVFISRDGGLSWTRASKPPTGGSRTYVVLSADFAESGRAYAATSGTESALSRSTDGGDTWDQVGLIDTSVSAVVDLAVSPRYRQDGTLFLLTFDAQHTEHSLWRSLTGGETWQRVFASAIEGVGELRLVKVSDEYGPGKEVVYLAGSSNSGPAVWKSEDGGETFLLRDAPVSVDAWDEAGGVLFVAGFDGSTGWVYRSDSDGAFTGPGASVGSAAPSWVAISPDYLRDGIVLVGNMTGDVYWSQDSGASFRPLGQRLPLEGGSGRVSAIFDPAFASNRTVYAATDAAAQPGSGGRIFRFIVGKSDAWENIDGSLPDGAVITGLAISDSGALYGLNSQPADEARKKGGVERSLDPRHPLAPTFERVVRALEDGAVMSKLCLSDNRLWALDTQNVRLLSYVDTLSAPVILASPENRAPGVDTTGIRLDWVQLAGATEYQWQLSHGASFGSIPEGFEGTTTATSVHVAGLEPGTKYYWRVRASRPVLSPWSARWSFTTLLGGSVPTIELLSPKAGVAGVALRPVFQWSAVVGAESYELLVSGDIQFEEPVIRKEGADSLPATAWQSDVLLEHDTTYYWKVRGLSKDSYSPWSAVGAFRTESLPPPPPPPQNPAPAPQAEPEPPPEEPPSRPLPETPPEPPPEPVQEGEVAGLWEEPAPPLRVEIIVPNWATYLVVALLSAIVVLLIVVVVLVVGMRRL